MMLIKKREFIMLSLLLLAGLAFSEPAPECIKDGVKYGVTRGSFRSEWWNYLERGMSYLEGGCYEAALADLDKAIELRKKQVKKEHDKRRARTYGLHFTDYFAHREKGVALYHLGRYEEAKKELMESLKWVDSERAREYLEMNESRLKALAH
jgi:tetratricopeptide (TPR) repeat protein